MITNETAKSIYTIADGVTSYAVGFLYNKNPDGTPQIKLYLNNHPELPLVYGTDYTLSGDELSVVLLDNYSVGDRLHILRNIPMVQLSDYVIGRIDPEQVETDFDESVMRDQQLKAEIDTLSELPIDHEQRITTIEEEIPDEASSSNQLADKVYVGTQINAHTSRTDNPHSVTAAQIGLGNCDNTSDANKPVSTATQNALDLKANSADLATVATSGSYNDLLNTPTLGTAAATDATDYATAAQGGLADTAVQPGDLATVATSGSYADLLNTPTLGTMAAESASDYTPSASLATVATSGLYSDLSGTPTVPTTLAALTGDVSVSTPTAGDHLVYNGTSQKWENTPSSAAISWGGITGDPKNQTDMLNVAKWSSNVTNCITEIPQDIKLELNNGTLTLKAGSKVYVPNGAGVFDEVVIASDLTNTIAANSQILLVYNVSNPSIWWTTISNQRSGTTNPSDLYGFFYNTTDNKVYYLQNSSTPDNDTFSLPIAIVTSDGTKITSINQVFNGFGYIGSTVFALPGVKGLIPDGRNADGSLENVEFTVSNVLTRTFASPGTYLYSSIALLNTGLFDRENYYTLTEDNYLLGSDNVIYQGFEVFRIGINQNAKITAFAPKTAFHAVDYSDTEYMAHQAMPSDRYVNLTFAHGQSYIAPADGYFMLCGYVPDANLTNVGGIHNQSTGLGVMTVPSTTSGAASRWCLPVKKGESVIMYLYNGTVTACNFVYAEGLK